MHRYNLGLLSICTLTLSSIQAQETDKPLELEPVVVTADPLGALDKHIARPVTVLRAERLFNKDRRNIGETVADEVGVTSSDFGPNVGRPIIRALSGPRVRVLEDGIDSLDVSTVSVDHGVTIEPIFADQIEIFRGPATLLYGSGASGGIVNVMNNRILHYVPEGTEGDLRFDYNSVADDKLGAGRLNAGFANFAFHVDGLKRDTDDYDIPGFAEIDPEPGEKKGVLENSDVETENYGGGVSFVGDRGFVGLAVSRFTNDYGVPGGHEHAGEGEEQELGEEEGGVRIDQDQTRLDFKAELTDPVPWFQAFKTRWAYNDYKHREREPDPQETGTLFKNEEWEGRAEVIHNPIGSWEGVLGLHYRDRDFSAVGEEAFVPPSETDAIGGFVLEKSDWGPWHFEVGARFEYQDSKRRDGTANADHDLFSVSGGAVWNFIDDYEVGVSISRAQRAPTIEELFADGPHLATNTFEIGDPSLDEETSNNFDLSLRKVNGKWTWTLNLFANLIDDFIFLQESDLNGDGVIDRVNEEGELVVNEDELLLVNNLQEDARFYGVEFETIVGLLNDTRGKLDLRVWGDYVRGKLDDGEDLPRITPPRFGAGLEYQRGPWHSGINFTHVFDQDDVAPLETKTDGYTMFNAYADYALSWGPVQYTLFARGRNMLDEEARRATSFLKDRAPLPGASAVVGIGVTF